MPRYTPRFFTEGDFAETNLTIKNPRAALRKARALEENGDTWVLDFRHYDSTGGIEQIEITNGKGKVVAKWIADELRMRLAVPTSLRRSNRRCIPSIACRASRCPFSRATVTPSPPPARTQSARLLGPVGDRDHSRAG